MCRNIHVLHNFAPPAASEEVRAASLQYVRKVAGMTKPSQANQEAFDRAVDQVAAATQEPARLPGDGCAAEGPGGRGGQGQERSRKRFATQAG